MRRTTAGICCWPWRIWNCHRNCSRSPASWLASLDDPYGAPRRAKISRTVLDLPESMWDREIELYDIRKAACRLVHEDVNAFAQSAFGHGPDAREKLKNWVIGAFGKDYAKEGGAFYNWVRGNAERAWPRVA